MDWRGSAQKPSSPQARSAPSPWTSQRSCACACPGSQPGTTSLRPSGHRSGRRARLGWGLSREVPAEPVGRDRIAMTAVCGPGPTWQGGQSAKARPPHQPLNAAASDAAAVPPKDGVHPRRAVGPAALGVDQPDVFQQRPVGRSPPALGPSSPRVVATGRQSQNLAHHPNRPDLAMLIDEPELHREAAPKMSAAFMEWPAPHLSAS
ncbi:MAG: hypothetical protein ACI9LT_003434 [Pseudoalteromonas distincta]